MMKYASFRTKLFSYLIDRRAVWMTFILGLFVILAGLISIGVGEIFMTPVEVGKALFGYGTEMNELVVKQFRFPRVAMAILAGGALAVSGAILQGMIRNPLASPDILGITWGGALATIGFLTIFSDRANALTVSIQWLPLASFIGAIATGFLVFVLSYKNGISPIRLVLIGIGLAAVLQALTTLLMIVGPIYRASDANIWITGSVHGTNGKDVLTLLPWVAILLLVLMVYSRRVNLQELGDDVAKGAGAILMRDRIVLLFISTGLAGGAVAFAGGIGFVGLMAPHIARKLVGASFGVLVPASALVGSMLVIIADLIGRTLFSPLEVPAGVFTAAIGAPYFVYLLYRSRNL
ncbi:FecCD family ABC transporter permease [Alkalihalobacillus sp. CinArs1]|uniref:FecCD family ABC transporter permease n=1 Tax=Alkalihalobacillus sp. CinArs1 TaxID=2995314 RepID=UPI0022DD3674|nr:iron ABC transporter permease [Alkalihalobacillus sp. CinArs1]